MKERLVKLMDYLGFSATRFADEIRVQRSSISHILSGRNNPSYDFIVKTIGRFPDINAEWILTGKGNMLKSERYSGDNPEPSLFSQISAGIKDPVKRDKTSDLNQKQNQQEEQNNMVTNVNRVEKIVCFFQNGTFREYYPFQEK